MTEEVKDDPHADTEDASSDVSEGSDYNEHPAKFSDNGLEIWDLNDILENVQRYNRGGSLPIHLGDCFGRFKVVFKLGHGRFGDVWLVRDKEDSSGSTKYYALKVFHARASFRCPDLLSTLTSDEMFDLPVNLTLPLEYFSVKGPNGRHLVIIYYLRGPNLFLLLLGYHEQQSHYEFSDIVRRKMCRQVVEAVAALHQRHICHGNINLSHILIGAEVDGLSEHKLVQDWSNRNPFSNIRTVTKRRSREEHQEIFGPQYAVFPPCWLTLGTQQRHLTDEVYLSDSPSMWQTSNPPQYIPPEILNAGPKWTFDNTGDIRGDISSLGFTLFAIRTGDVRLSSGSIGEALELAFDQYYQEPINTKPSDYQTELDLFTDLLEKMMRRRPEERLTAREVLDHPWFKI